MSHRLRKSIPTIAAALLAGVMTLPTGAGASPAVNRTYAADGSARTMVLPAAREDNSARDSTTATVGENPAGRVSQPTGYSGYTFGYSDTMTMSVDVTLPSVGEGGVSDPPSPWQSNMAGSEASVGLFNGGIGVQLFADYNTVGDGWQGMRVISSLDSGCSAEGQCPTYQPGLFPGDVVEMWVDTSPSATSAGIVDLTSGATMSWSGNGLTAASPMAEMIEQDYCYAEPSQYSVDEPCTSSVPDFTAPTPPPGFEPYGQLSFTNATVIGSPLGVVLAANSLAFWSENNSVWTATLDDQTSWVGSGSSFTITEVNMLLPAATVTVSSPGVERPKKGKTTTLDFTINIPFSVPDPVYVDYSTSDGTATSGTDYVGVSGWVEFPANTTTFNQVVPVTIIGGPEEQGQRQFAFSIGNPSYAVEGSPGSATGTIYDGPIVFAVAPQPVPVDGGSIPLEITGAHFAPGDVVTFCDTAQYNPSSCLTASDITVVSNTEIDLVAPDATPIQPVDGSQKVTQFTADTIVTDDNGVSSPIWSPDQMAFGCAQTAILQGQYVVGGCLTDEAYRQAEVTQQASFIDGMTTSGSPGDQVSYSVTSPGVTSAASSTVSVTLGKVVTAIYRGVLGQSLSTEVNLTVPANTKLGGLAVSGNLTLDPVKTGVAHGSVTVTLPAPIVAPGGAPATGTLTFTAQAGALGGSSSLTAVQIKVPGPVSLSNLFSLSDLDFTYSSGTWTVSGVATSFSGSEGKKTSTFAGTYTTAGNTITKASLDVSAISLSGILDISNLMFMYGSTTGWSGTATLTEPGPDPQPTQATVSLAFTSAGQMTAGSLVAENINLFGALPLQQLSITYSSTDGWTLATTAKPGFVGEGTLSASLAVNAAGEITAANITLSKGGTIPLYGYLTLTALTLDYASPKGVPTYTAEASVQLPTPATTVVSGVYLKLVIANGDFQQGKFVVSGSVPLVDGVYLTELGGSVTVPAATGPFDVCGQVGLGLGPEIKGEHILGLTGDMDFDFNNLFSMAGEVTMPKFVVDSGVLGYGYMTSTASGTKVQLALGTPTVEPSCPLQDPGPSTGLKLPLGITVTAQMSGSISAGGISVVGSGSFTYPKIFHKADATGTIQITDSSVTACATDGSDPGLYGFAYNWAKNTVKRYSGNCPVTTSSSAVTISRRPPPASGGVSPAVPAGTVVTRRELV